jgi:hypothetical protein
MERNIELGYASFDRMDIWRRMRSKKNVCCKSHCRRPVLKRSLDGSRGMGESKELDCLAGVSGKTAETHERPFKNGNVRF